MKKSNVNSRSVLNLACICFLLFSPITLFNAYAQNTANFSGTWKYDISRSDTLPSVTSATLVITQNGNEITINRTLETRDTQPINGVFKYTMGKRVESESKNGTNICVSAWSDDKQSFTITDIILKEKDGVKQELKRITTYSISDNGNTLIITSDDTFPTDRPSGHKNHYKQVYIKA